MSEGDVINTNAGRVSYAYCLGSAGQERLLTEVDKPIGMTVWCGLLEGGVCEGGDRFATRAFRLCCYKFFLSDSPSVCPQLALRM